MSIRVFFAVDVVATDALEALLDRIARSGADIKPVGARNLHSTLLFLGDAAEADVPALAGALRDACANVPPFTVELAGTGAFPGMSRINVVWAGMRDDGSLVRLAGGIRERAAALGMPGDGKEFRPHLTLARVRSGRGIGPLRDLVAGSAGASFGTFTVSNVRFKRSVLSSQGPLYSDLEVVELVKR